MVRLHGRRRGGLAAWLVAATLAGCGGGQAPGPALPADQTFESRAMALAQSAGTSDAPTAPNALANAEVQRRSREWAVAAITDPTLPSGSAVTAPPVYFGLAFALDAAAFGQTHDELNAQLSTTDAKTQAALQHGLNRSVRAGATTTFATTFLDAVTAAVDRWPRLVPPGSPRRWPRWYRC